MCVCVIYRLVELEGEVGGARERAAQLQVEKEKALSDLKNIRKINRTMEKSVTDFIDNGYEKGAGINLGVD